MRRPTINERNMGAIRCCRLMLAIGALRKSYRRLARWLRHELGVTSVGIGKSSQRVGPKIWRPFTTCETAFGAAVRSGPTTRIRALDSMWHTMWDRRPLCHLCHLAADLPVLAE